jgi:hypothetical protein
MAGVKYTMSNPSYALWSIWRELPILLDLFLLILLLVSIYTLFSATTILVRLHSIKNQNHSEDAFPFQHLLATLKSRTENIRQLISAIFYLFGIMLFWIVPFVIRTAGNSYAPLWKGILEGCFTYSVFASNVFFILLVLHLIQWFVAVRVRACSLRLNSKKIDQLRG